MSIVVDQQDIGELMSEPFDFIKVVWKVPDVLSLPDCVDYKVQSPLFYFAGATWRLEMNPYGETKYNSEGYIDLGIIRFNYLIPKQHIFYKLYFKTFCKKEFGSACKSYYYDPNASDGGIFEFMEKSKFIQMKNVLFKNGTLTIVCEMRMKKFAEVHKAYQLLSSKSLQLTEEQSKEESLPSTSGIKDSSAENSKEEPRSSATTCKGIEDVSKTYLPDNKILSDFKAIFLKQEDCDVTLRVQGKEFYAHRLILKARSSVFASTFRNDMKEKSSGIIDIEDCDPSTFSSFLSFLYSGDVENLSVENTFSLFTTADKYDVQDLRKNCLEFMKKNLSVYTFCDTIRLALLHSETALIKLSTDFFVKNLREIIGTVKWQTFLTENPIYGNELFMKALPPAEDSK